MNQGKIPLNLQPPVKGPADPQVAMQPVNMAARKPSPPDHLTKQKIIDSALTLYAQKGIDGVPVRELTAHAGVNIAAIHYHFGGTAALAEEVFSELAAQVNRRRTLALADIIEAARQKGRRAEVADIVAAFVEPYVGPQSATEGQLLAQLILKHRLSPSEMTERVIKKHFDPMAKAFVAALHASVPEVSLDLMYRRYMLMVSTVVLSTSDRGSTSRLQRLLGKKASASEGDVLKSTLVEFIVAGMQGQAK